MADRPENTRVNIYGREYSIRGEGDPAYIAEIAHFLDMRMRQMTENVTMTSTAKVSILASLNIIDELFSKTEQLEEMEDAHQMYLSSLAARIEEALEETGASQESGSISELSNPDSAQIPTIFQKSGEGRGDE